MLCNQEGNGGPGGKKWWHTDGPADDWIEIAILVINLGTTFTLPLPIAATDTPNLTHLTGKLDDKLSNLEKPVGDWISAPSPNFVAMATGVGPKVQWIADFPQAELTCQERDQGWRRVNVALCAQIGLPSCHHTRAIKNFGE